MNLIFCCTGNINRSPAAEIIFNRVNRNESDVAISAAVSGKNEGRLTNKRTREALERSGYKYQEIRSKPLTAGNIEWADLIFYMQEIHRTKLIKKFGENLNCKLLPLFQWSSAGVNKIPDPHFEKEDKAFDSMIILIENCVNNMIDEKLSSRRNCGS